MEIVATIIMVILGLFAWSSCVLASRSDEDLEESMLDPSDKER